MEVASWLSRTGRCQWETTEDMLRNFGVSTASVELNGL